MDVARVFEQVRRETLNVVVDLEWVVDVLVKLLRSFYIHEKLYFLDRRNRSHYSLSENLGVIEGIKNAAMTTSPRTLWLERMQLHFHEIISVRTQAERSRKQRQPNWHLKFSFKLTSLTTVL